MSTQQPTAPPAARQATNDRFRTRPADHRFFAAMAILAAALIVTGFANTYAPKVFAGAGPVPPVVHLHAALFGCWLILFVTQTTLAARGRMATHRRLGNAGVVLAAVMLLVGAITAVTVARLGHRGIPGVEFPNAAGFLLLNLTSLVVFTTLAGAGWILRNRPQAHKRLMLMAVVGGLTPPGIARLPLVGGHPPAIAGVAMALLLATPLYDLVSRRRIHPASAAGFLLTLLSIPPVVAALSASAAWGDIAAWLMR